MKVDTNGPSLLNSMQEIDVGTPALHWPTHLGQENTTQSAQKGQISLSRTLARRDTPSTVQGRSERRDEEVRTALRVVFACVTALGERRNPSRVPTSDTLLLRVEALRVTRRKLAGFFTILLGLH